MRFIITLVLLLWLAGCTANDKPAVNRYALIESTGVTVTIEKQDDVRWLAHYVFETPQTAMLFSRSGGNYRTGSWTSIDDNVRLERLSGFDALLFAKPNTSARLTFVPYTQNVPKDYTPFIPFSDGGAAVFTGQFDLMPAADAAYIEALNGDIRKWEGKQPRLGVRVLSKTPMIQNAKILNDEAIDMTIGGGDYIYVGSAKITQGTDFIGVIDPGLPQWLSSRFDKDISNIFEGHRQMWGDGLKQKSMVLFSFRGYGTSGFTNKGGALGNMLALETSGDSLRTESEDTLNHFHWFFAHEAAHLFQNRAGVNLGDSHQAWITEGAANAMANNVLRHQNLADDAYILSEYAKEYEQCTLYVKTQKLSEAAQNGQFKVLYACGDIIAQITDAVLKDHTLFEFWNVMLRDAKEKTTYSAHDYFAAMQKLGAPESIIDGLRGFTDGKSEAPVMALQNLMKDSGLAPKFDGDGKLISLKLP